MKYISVHSQHVSIMHIKHLIRRANVCKHTEDDELKAALKWPIMSCMYHTSITMHATSLQTYRFLKTMRNWKTKLKLYERKCTESVTFMHIKMPQKTSINVVTHSCFLMMLLIMKTHGQTEQHWSLVNEIRHLSRKPPKLQHHGLFHNIYARLARCTALQDTRAAKIHPEIKSRVSAKRRDAEIRSKCL